MNRWLRVYLLPDGGDGGAGTPSEGASAPVSEPGESPVSAETTAPSEPAFDRPKYFSQVAPAKADSEDYKALWKYQKLDELADAAIALQKENETLKANAQRSIVVPDGKDPEAVKEFARKLGIPDGPEGYKMQSMKDLHLDDDTMSTIRKYAHKAMLSERQAETFGNMLLQVSKKGLQNAKDAAEARKMNFDNNLRASYSELSSDTDRASAADRDKASFRAFLEETGLAKHFDRNGSAYDPEMVRGIAAYQRKHSGQVQVQSVPGGKVEQKRSNPYGDSFNKTYGGR